MPSRIAILALLSSSVLASAAHAAPTKHEPTVYGKAPAHQASKAEPHEMPKLKPPKYVLPIQFVVTADDNGGRSSTLTETNAQAAIERANAVYRRNGGDVAFSLHPASNFGDPIESTALNRDCIMASGQTYASIDANTDGDLDNDGQVGTQADTDRLCDFTTPGNARTAYAIERSDRIIVFSRGGDDKVEWDGAAGHWVSSRPTGGQSGSNMAYVRMPDDFGGSTLLAHELGHYFHNPHTFREGDPSYNPSTVQVARQAMEAWAVSHPGDDPREVFDGDGLDDTPYDPRKTLLKKAHKQQGATGCDVDPALGTVSIPVTVGGTTTTMVLTPDRANVMSYFKGCAEFNHHLSDGQYARVHAALAGNRSALVESDSGCYSSGSSGAVATTEEQLRSIVRKVSKCLLLTRKPMPWEKVIDVYSHPGDVRAGFEVIAGIGVHAKREKQLLRLLRAPGIED